MGSQCANFAAFFSAICFRCKRDGSAYCVINLSELGSNASRRRFMAAFSEALYEANEEPLHLVLDEALICGRRSGRSKAGKASWITSRRSCDVAACAVSSRG
jgi:hypothetical protein